MDLGLKGSAAWVTGASRGIGLACARRLLEEGASVLLSARGAEGLETARAALALEFGADRVQAAAGDAGDAKDAQAAVAVCRAAWGRLDILVANAGTGRIEGGDHPSEADWRMAMDLNVLTAAQTLRQALPLLGASGPASVVVVGSIAGLEDFGAPAAYAAAKAALHAWAKTAARDLAPRNIRVNAVIPGNIMVPGGVWDLKRAAKPDAIEAYIRREVPLARFGMPEEIADAVAFLSSKRSAFITGASLVADGGQTRSLA